MKTAHKMALVCMFGSGVMAPLAHAAEVRMMFGLALPPYVIKENNSGYELEIIREALAVKGHTLKPTFAAFGASKQMLKDKQVDAAQRGNPDMSEADGFHYAAEPTVLYEDVAISLAKNKVAVASMADLKNKNVVAYQGATQFIGPDYAAIVKSNPNYQENSSSKRVVQMLYAGGAQVAVFDINIFKYIAGTLKGEVDIGQEVTYHKVFPTSTIKTNNPVFLDKQVRDDFNAGLAQLKKNGRYKEIIKKYVNQ
jgi:polar amino acid transport system substrate-binding protein